MGPWGLLGRALASLALFATSAPLSAVAAPADVSRLVVGQALEPPGLDPTAGAAVAIKEVAFQTIFEGLVKLGPSGRIDPLLADRWSVSPDGLVYSFHLRPDVVFHDGSALTASDVKFTFDRDRAAGSTNAQKGRFQLIDQIQAPDPSTVVLRLKHRFGGLLTLLSWGDAAILSPRSASGDGVHPIGTGPFRFEAWRRGDLVSLVRNQRYWGARPKLDSLVFRFIGDPTAAYAALDAGDVDAFANFPAPETLARLARDPRFRVAIAPTEGKTILSLNNRQSPLNDLRVRQALSYAIDRQAVIAGAVNGYGRAIGSHYPPQDPGYVDLTGVYPYDPSRAKALLRQAGYPHGFSLTLKLPPPFYARRAGDVIAAELAAIGITCKIELVEWAPWLDQVFARHDFSMTIVNHAESMDYDIYARPDYYFGYRSARYDALYAALEDTVDPDRRSAILGDMQRQLAGDAVNVFLFDYPALGVWSARVHRLWAPTAISQFDFAAADIDGGANSAGQTQGGGSTPGWVWTSTLAPLLALFIWAAVRAGPHRAVSRLIAMGLTLAAASVVIFVLLQIAPGDSARFMMGMNADEASVEALRRALGLSGPPWRRYLTWIGGIAHGDLGLSYTYRVPVAGLVLQRLSLSLPLTFYALVISTMTAFAAGLLAAARPRGLCDRAFAILTTLGVAIPNFWFGLVLVVIFASGLRLFSSGGFPGWGEGLGPALKALTLPALALALPQAAILARVLRAELLARMGEDYIRTARAKGLTQTGALIRHALPNALIPVLTILGLQFSFLLAGAVIVENVFYLPGLGRLLIQAVSQRDLITVQDVVLLLVLGATTATLLTDLVYVAIDPRLRARG